MTWRERFGQEIEWLKSGYVFPVSRETEEKLLKSFLPFQKEYGLNINFKGPDEIAAVVPGINRKGLIGGTISPDDDSVSPLLACNFFSSRAGPLAPRFNSRPMSPAFW
nr:FAD-dependent oxidoreductase [uncultured Desulfobacter sp.]